MYRQVPEDEIEKMTFDHVYLLCVSPGRNNFYSVPMKELPFGPLQWCWTPLKHSELATEYRSTTFTYKFAKDDKEYDYRLFIKCEKGKPARTVHFPLPPFEAPVTLQVLRRRMKGSTCRGLRTTLTTSINRLNTWPMSRLVPRRHSIRWCSDG